MTPHWRGWVSAESSLGNTPSTPTLQKHKRPPFGCMTAHPRRAWCETEDGIVRTDQAQQGSATMQARLLHNATTNSSDGGEGRGQKPTRDQEQRTTRIENDRSTHVAWLSCVTPGVGEYHHCRHGHAWRTMGGKLRRSFSQSVLSSPLPYRMC